jgi:hypothetical protein
VAEILTAVSLTTGLVVTVNVALVAFAATDTFAGTWAAPALLLDRVTTAPAAGAGAVKVTVPVAVLPPSTDSGFSVIDATVGNDVKLNPVTSVLLIVAVWLDGLKANPALLGVTVYDPLGSPPKV